MIRSVITCLITAAAIAHVTASEIPQNTYVAKSGAFSPPEPEEGEVVTWKPGSPDSVNGLVFGVNAFDSIIAATAAAGAEKTVYIASGTYTEGNEIFVNKTLNFHGDGPGLTIIDGASSHPLFSLNSSATIKDLTIQNGSAPEESGVITSSGLELTLSNIHFVDNSAASGFAVLLIESPLFESIPHVVRIEGCLFNSNIIGDSGSSCIYHDGFSFGQGGSDVIIANTTFSSNEGLAIRSLDGALTLTQCTFYNNPPGAFEGSSVTLKNSLVLDSYVAEGVTSNGSNFLADGPITAGDLSYSNTTASVPEDLIDIVLSDNGGATATHKLSANSVAIDAGRNADALDTLGNPLEFDQRGPGFPRISRGIVDIGAFEVLFVPPLNTYVAESGDFSPPNPKAEDVVTWKPGSPDSVENLVFGVNAFDSIIAASSAVGEGGTVYIASGTYTEGREIFVEKALHFHGDGPGLTILDGASSHSLFSLIASTTIKDLTIQNGLGDFYAGGISSFGSDLTLSNVHFVGNSSQFGSGALFILGKEGESIPHVVRIEGCLFNDNTAGVGGSSCIYHDGYSFGQGVSDVKIANTTFSSNEGLAIRSLDGSLTLTHCTFYGNLSGAFDASDGFEESQEPSFIPGSSVTLNNSLVLDSYVAEGVTSNGFNFLADGPITAGDRSYSNTTASDPADLIEIELSDNGGATATHKLSANSVAIDAGRNADALDTLGNPLEFDQRGPGFPRISRGIVDIGAFENLLVPTLTLSLADESISENGGSTTVTVSRNTDTEIPLTVSLSSSDETEATVPATLIIPAGQVSATAILTAVDDAVVDGTQSVTISATADGFIGDSAQLDVTDDDLLQITLEGGGTLSEPDSFSSSPLSPSETNLILKRNGTLGDVVVNIAIAPGSQAEIGNDFTINGASSPNFSVTIPDGESELAIPVQVLNDMAAEANETFVVLLLPGSFISGNNSVSFTIAQNDYGVISLEDFNSFTDPNGGEGTLRQAIANAKAGLTLANTPPSDPVIIFHPDLSGEIMLTAGAFLLDQSSFSIIGPGSQQVSISGEDSSRIFFISDPAKDLVYSISGLTMTGGFSPANGGAIFSTESLILSDCVLSESTANIGGAISNEGSLELHNCTLFNNTATIYGGAIDNFSGRLSLRGCTLFGNHAEFGGGIENASGSELWVDSSTFYQNSAGESGGAIDSFKAITNISNTTISGNQAGFGGGIFNEQSAVSIWQSTIVENIALISVGGILTSSAIPVSTTLHNTIVAGNTASGRPSDLSTNNPSFANVNRFSSNNLIGHANTAGGLSNGINGNIVGVGGTNIFRPLGDNGGPSLTHALPPGSPAINAGNPAFALDSEGLPLTTDQRGFPRFVFGTNDIGAFEVSENPISIVSLDAKPGVSAAISWTSEAGVSYDVLRSTDLSTWNTIANGITAVSGLTRWTDNNPPLDRAFYIIRSSAAQ